MREKGGKSIHRKPAKNSHEYVGFCSSILLLPPPTGEVYKMYQNIRQKSRPIVNTRMSNIKFCWYEVLYGIRVLSLVFLAHTYISTCCGFSIGFESETIIVCVLFLHFFKLLGTHNIHKPGRVSRRVRS